MNIVVIGAGGHGRVVIDILRHDASVGFICSVDDDVMLHNTLIDGAPVLGKIHSLPALIQSYRLSGAIIAMGDNKNRAYFYNYVLKTGLKVINAIHPHALIARDVTIGDGVVIAPGAIIGTYTSIGNNVIINTGVILEHNNTVGDHVHISPGANIAGNVSIKKYTHIGLGVSAIDNVLPVRMDSYKKICIQ